MSTTSQLTDFSDLYTDLLNRARADTALTATATQAKRYINIALQDMHVGFGEKFPWSERHAILTTQAEYTTGTVTVTQGSTTLTGTSTAWNTNNSFGIANMRVDGKIVIDGGKEVYTISAVASDTSATISSAFVQADVTAGTYVYFEDEYDLASDFLRPIDLQSFDINGEIELIPRREFRMRYPRNKTTGKPLVGTIHDRAVSSNTTPRRRITFWKPPDNVFMIPYNYVTGNLALSSAGAGQTGLSADADEPIVPLHCRHLIVFHALYNWYRDKKHDSRAQEARQEYADLLMRVVGDQEVASARAQIRPRIGHYKNRARRPYSGRGSRYTVGDAFDELRFP